MLTNTGLILDDLSFLHQVRSFQAYVNASRGGGGGGEDQHDMVIAGTCSTRVGGRGVCELNENQ